ncbi:hypothetical protein EC957_005929 [Mortierella hygrophila]|uniref:F-box domain-containing protein n=1 Tax=Mortierella hygrophila TaxID=979708 RepID=A0A9P6FDY5_9FUNG|nr:hypothetical protein EC957_005929 [Mortierella hygrophila]
MTSIHPLKLPEIITLVGNFLPLWSQERAQGTGRLKLVFLPKTFHTCLLVSKIWHDTLIPLLWSYYEAEAMEVVPLPTLTRYSIHFRTFCQYRGCGSRALDSFGCRRVVKAMLSPETIEELEESRRMMKDNDGGLKELEWNGPTGSTLRVEDFAGLRSLERLKLSRWKVDGGQLWRVLEMLVGSLRVLEIDWLSGVDDDGGDVQGAAVTLALLEAYCASYGPDPANFVKRCPNLVRSVLSLDTGKGYYKDDNKDMARLADSLRTHCPNLRALTINGSIPPDQKAILIRNCASIPSSSSLLELVVDVQSMSKDLMDSILIHAQTLETLGTLTSTRNIMMEQLLQIPVQCPRLKWFAVHAIYTRESAWSILGALKAAAWQSSAMEILDLDAGDPSEAWVKGEVFMLKDLFASGPILGWYFHPKEGLLSYSDDGVFWSEAFARELFEAVEGLEKLRILRWCGNVFARSSFYDRAYTPLLY